MNLWLAVFIALLLGFLAGNYTALIAVKWAQRQRKAMRDLIADIYHKDLLPEVCRVEGLINLALLDLNPNYMRAYCEKAYEAIKKHHENIVETLRKYHKWS